MAMLVHACLQIIGLEGYEILINNSLEKARYFSELIKKSPDFELITAPELCILTYRYVPNAVQLAMSEACKQQDWQALSQFNELLDGLTQFIQKHQREQGKSFVSRTRIQPARYNRQHTTVFRVVLANPLTGIDILQSVLAEQQDIAALDNEFLPQLLALAKA
jgi:aspartate 1-decarboxylase